MRAVLALIAIVLTAAPAPIDVVISRSIDTTPERATDLSTRVATALSSAGLEVRSAENTTSLLGARSPAACSARRACLKEVAAKLGSRALVGVDVGHVSGQMGVNLEAIDAAGNRLAAHSFAVESAGYPAGMAQELSVFVEALRKALPAEDAPKAVALVPAPALELTPVLVEAPAARSVAPWVLGAGAAAAAIAAAALFAVHASSAGQLEAGKTTIAGQPASTLSRPQAEQLASTANGTLAGGFVAAGAAAGLAMTAILWRVSE